MAMRRSAAKAEDYALRHGVPRWTTDADQLIRDPEVDAVYIATPPGSHLEYALRVAAAGKPAYVEKPMARNHTECHRMIEAFSQAGLPLFVAFYRRRLPRFLKAKEPVESGRLGQVTMLNDRYADARLRDIDPQKLEWRLAAEQAGGGIFLDMGCHAPIFSTSSSGRSKASRAGPLISHRPTRSRTWFCARLPLCLGCPGGLRLELRQRRLRGPDRDYRHAGGRLTLSVFGNEPLRLATGAGLEPFELPNPPHIQQPLIQSIVDQLHGQGECPSTGATAARTSRVMDQVLASYYGGRDDAFWTRPETWPGRRC